MKKIFAITLILFPLTLTACKPTPQTPSVTDFDSCVAAGNPVMESYPRQCSAAGQTYVEDIGNELEKQDLIKVDSPRPNSTVKSPLTITGQAVGTWFFEASFPIELIDKNGSTIGQTFATAQGEWMTVRLVPFTATLKFTPQMETGQATLILKKDNPSDQRELDDQLEIPVKY